MPASAPVSPEREAARLARQFAAQAFSRAAGAPLVAGNSVRILRNATENFPAWLAAIRAAQRTIFFENYIIADDAVGREFAAALAESARHGVRVRVLYDWMGALGSATQRVLQPVAAAGGEVRCFNPPRLDSPLGWPTPILSASRRMFRRCAPLRLTVWTCGCWCRARAICRSSRRCRGRATGRCSRPVSVSSNGTGP